MHFRQGYRNVIRRPNSHAGTDDTLWQLKKHVSVEILRLKSKTTFLGNSVRNSTVDVQTWSYDVAGAAEVSALGANLLTVGLSRLGNTHDV